MQNKFCVICNTQENLNNTMTITLDDGQKVQVYLCDTHAEDTTVKAAKIAYSERKKKLDDLLAQAAALGFNLSTTSSGITVNAPKEVKVEQVPQIITEDAEELIDASLIDNASMNIRLNGDGAMGMDRSYNTAELQKIAGPAKAKVDVVNIRGIDMVIPTKKVDSSGTTTIKINNSFDDRAMQQKFKNMASESVNGNNITSYKDGYQVRSCPLCGGRGYYRNNGKDVQCAKCDGAGEIFI